MKILIVEDDKAIGQELKILLENALYEVELVKSFTGVAEHILSVAPDLVLLDVNLPEETGFQICTQVRQSSEVPIIFLTSNTDAMNELTGMLKGGDDYIAKPFQAPILLARIAAVLKRYRKNDNPSTQLEYKGVSLDMTTGLLAYEGRQVDLTKTELRILYCLFSKKGQIVSRMDLIDALWDNQVFIDDNTLSVHITRIRGKLTELGLEQLIETKRGMGYQLI